MSANATRIASRIASRVAKRIPWTGPEVRTSFVAGLPQASWSPTAGLSPGTIGGTGRTFLQSAANDTKVRRACSITNVAIRTFTGGNGHQGGMFKLVVFRWDGAKYTRVAESEGLTTSSGVATFSFDLATPLSVLAGDAIGIYLADGEQRIACQASTGDTIIYGAGSQTASTGLTTTLADFVLCLECLAPIPNLAITGDSIVEGHNQGTYHGYLHDGVTLGGSLSAEPGYAIKQIKGNSWTYANCARGSQTFAWIRSTGVPEAINSGARKIWIHCGVNDVSQARTWAQVEADLDAIRLLVPQSTGLYLTEILPWTAGTDAQAGTIRTWNANLATWCTANNATLILCHDVMGQTRASTGELDDLLTSYNHDGVHLTTSGVSAFAAIVAAAIP